jgi:hypothetical protein
MSFRDIEEIILNGTQSAIGRDITYEPASGDPVTIKGIYDKVYIESEDVMSLRHTVRINLSDLDAAPAKGDTVTIATIGYTVTEHRDDGYGGSLLILNRS